MGFFSLETVDLQNISHIRPYPAKGPVIMSVCLSNCLTSLLKVL